MPSTKSNGTTLTDASGNGNNGVIAGAKWSRNAKFGTSLLFSGNNWVTIPDSSSLSNLQQMTIEAWVYPLAEYNWRTVALKEGDGQLCYGLYASSDNGVPAGSLSVADYGYIETRAPTKLRDAVWSHLATTYDGSQVTLYINGIPVSSYSDRKSVWSIVLETTGSARS